MLDPAIAHLVEKNMTARRIADRAAAGQTACVRTRPHIVCLCGSTRFSQAFREATLRETLAGHIVLSIGCDMRSDTAVFAGLTPAELAQVKARLDALHKEKIKLADSVLILNVGGYIGESTRSELDYARRLGKPVRFLCDPPAAA
jgi:hypothetical protein